MKLNLIPTIIAVLLSMLVTYAFYSFMPVAKAEPIFNFYVIACLLLSLITLVLSMGVSFERGRITAVIRIVSFSTFSLGIVSLVILSTFSKSIPGLIISSGITLVIYFLIVYMISKAE
ncbi:MAG: hypothetical protein CMD04_04155 [Flavobacteriales bacterium]|nr:hypothetical protein [Flavobacteriales bacterium]|tara:strand:+ start:80 stop:433 length:354 start_codon:yes stop_codon:yes gene_type:complete